MRRAALALLLLLAPAAGADENMTGKKEMFMSLCPSAVSGAKTEVTDTPDGVELVVTAREEPARESIRKRAHRQMDIALQPERGSMEHTGLGTGSGRYGHCPGMIQNTQVRVTDTLEGVRIEVLAYHRDEAAELQQITHQRADALKKQPRPLRPSR